MRKEFRGEFCVAYVRAGIVMNVIDYILDEAMVSTLYELVSGLGTCVFINFKYVILMATVDVHCTL